MLTKITALCQKLLSSYPGAEEVREYLNPRLSSSAQNDFQLGYFPARKELSLISNMISEDELLSSGLFYYKITYEEKVLASIMEQHNLIMPYKNAYGEIVALVGRTVLSEEDRKISNISKYKNTYFKKANHLFALSRAKEAIIKKNAVFVVEGQFDAMNAISNGIENVVCLGSGSMGFVQFALLNRYTDRIIMLLDNDEAGEMGTRRAIEQFGNRAKVNQGRIPEGYKDLDQFIMQEGKEAAGFLEALII